MKILRALARLSCVAVFSHAASYAQETDMIEQHTHVHGRWRMFAAMDGETLTVTLEGPGADVLGFEHPPESDAERDAVRALAATAAAGGLVALPAPAKCAPAGAPALHLPEGFADDDAVAATLAAQGLAGAEDPAHADHADSDDDGEEHDRHHHDVSVVYVFSCAAPDKVRRIRQRMFEAYPSIEEIEAAYLTATKQGAQALTRSSPDLRLK